MQCHHGLALLDQNLGFFLRGNGTYATHTQYQGKYRWERVRFGERLRVQSEIDPACEDCAVPALLLQPLVENAVTHGIANLLEGGLIRLTAHLSGADIAITVENAFDPESPARRDLGLGLKHVRRRLEIRYGEGAVFDAGARGEVYRVVLRFPCESPIASSKRE